MTTPDTSAAATPIDDEPVTLFMCNPKCEHDFQGWKPLFNESGQECGGSTVCTKCGRSAFDVSQWEDF